MNKVFTKGNKLVIEVPLTQTRDNPYDDKEWIGENIIGIIEPDPKCNMPRIGFAYRIDMSYKDKPDQWTDIFYQWHGDEKDFKEFCKDSSIEIYEYPQCEYCKGAIYGCFTFGKKGKMCMNCEDNNNK